MANKKGRSERKTDWLGRSYIQHFDSKGNKSGRSERKETFFGKKYTQHKNARGEKTGRSEKKETWLGREYTQKYNTRGEKSGRSEKKETWLGHEYRQHYDAKGNKTDWTEKKETWLGKKYVQRYGENKNETQSGQTRSTSASTYHDGGSNYSPYRASDYDGGSTSTSSTYRASNSATTVLATPSSACSRESSATADAISRLLRRSAQALLLGVFLYPVIGLGGCLTRIAVQGSPPHPYDPAHELWLTAPMRSWSTEAVYVPLLLVGITFLVTLVKIHQGNVPLKILAFILGSMGVIYVGRNLVNSIDYRFPQVSAARNTRTARVVADKDLNLRSGAGKQYSRTMTIPRNTPVLVLGETKYIENELWVKIRVGSTEGWVHNSFLR